MDGVEDPVNLLPEKGLGRRESSHLPLPTPTRQSWEGCSSPWGRRETGRDCVPEGLAVPREAQWCSGEEESMAQWPCPCSADLPLPRREFVSQDFFAVRAGEGQGMDGNEELVAPMVLPAPRPTFPAILQEKPSGPGTTMDHRPSPGCQ